MQPILLSIHKILLAHKKKIELLFLSLELAVFLFIFLIAALVTNKAISIGQMIELGHLLGTTSFIWFGLSLLPGIIRRLAWQPSKLIGVMLMLFRRHFGIMMFMSTLAHFCFVSVFLVVLGGIEVTFDPIRTAGFTAFLLAIPLWFTSNDFSERTLGIWWKRLHKLTYLILIAVFSHLLLLGTKVAFLAGVVLLLEIASWLVFWRKKVSQPQL